ncbi:hypothetical protein M5D96_013561 [Drosophila gunungcola]|uniref:Chitin-binding type-2 domain-containing protein n=1 Tax=Drosophila gunungcola TaxID=103775 RepID=A0A9P9YBV5_9MUSC|nr:hypothetical protein M5D96_013561 [Drosophila gunungcola]
MTDLCKKYLALIKRLTEAQSKRASRVTSSRSFGTNVKPSSSNGLSFDCPEEFGYYPHPSDCTQYYVCVFGGALLESCTGGLMYSHELQTCDWPRNVGCELVDTSSERGPANSQTQTHTQAQQPQHVPSRVRFGAAFSSQSGTQKVPTVAPQYHRSPPQVIQAQVQHIPPPPPELRVPPNPVITSRGQPKPLIDSQEEIAKLYVDAQETLPPVEEEESDRQQRVYRGQPSTVNQVQRDRDGIIHQASINAIPQAGKIGSYAFGTAYSESLNDDQTLEYELSHNRLDRDKRRKRRDLSARVTETSPAEPSGTENSYDSNTSSEVVEPDTLGTLLISSESSNSSNNSKERFGEGAAAITKPRKYSSKIRQPKIETAMEFDYEQIPDDNGELVGGDKDVVTGESKRRARQLRPVSQASSKWPGPNYRAIDAPSSPQYSQQTGYSFGSYNPYLSPPNPVHTQAHGSHNYNHLSPGYQPYQQQQVVPAGSLLQQKPKVVYTGYNLSLPPPPLEDDFRPIAGKYYGAAATGPNNQRPPKNQQQQSSAGDLLPYLIQQLKELKERRKHLQAENFAYFHLDNQPVSPAPASGTTFVPTASTTPHTPFAYYSPIDPSKPAHQVTPNGPYSTMGGFFNNQNPDQVPYTANYPAKVVSHYSIGAAGGQRSTTESNYFQYNIVANQNMKGIFSTAKPVQFGHSTIKIRPPVTPLQVTQSINVISAPNLAYNRPNSLQQVPFRDISHLPVGISYASNSTMPESYQTFTKSISTTEAPLREPTTTTPKSKLTNFQFNIHEFMANLKASDLASVNPAVNPLIKYFKQVSSDGNGNVNGNLRNALVLHRPVTGISSSTSSSITTAQIPTTPSPATTKTRLRVKPTVPTPATPSTTRALKGYENFIKGIQNQLNQQASSPSPTSSTSTTTLRVPTTTTLDSVDYYDEDYEEDEDILPPSQMPPYMPMSETMAPPRPQITAATPVPESAGKVRPNFQTGFLEATTTRRPFPNFSQLDQPSTDTDVPSFLSFPSDIFQELKQRRPQLPESNTLQTSTITRAPMATSSLHSTYNPDPTSSTAPPTTRVRYTARPRTRGQQKWMTMSPLQGQQDTKNLSANGPVVLDSSKQSNLGGLQLNSIHVGSGAERHRDIEYQQQQEQQPVAPQYHPTVRQQQSHSTYRPLELSVTQTPPQKPSYGNQPSLTYTTEYDEDINAQPTRSPQRQTEQVAIQRLESRATPSSAPSSTTSALPHDARTYYDTFTTTDPPEFGSADYSFSNSAEYAYGSVEDYDQTKRTLTRSKSKSQTDTDDFDLIANVVGPTVKSLSAPLTRLQSTKSTAALSRSQTNSFITTTQTVKVTQTETTTTTTSLPPTTTTKKQASTIRTTTTPNALAPPSTERYIVPGLSYAGRANYFKDSLNRVTANPAVRYVSPYKSLENLLQEDRQHQHHQLRTTGRPRFTNAPAFPPFLQTTSKPPKNLFMTTYFSATCAKYAANHHVNNYYYHGATTARSDNYYYCCPNDRFRPDRLFAHPGVAKRKPQRVRVFSNQRVSFGEPTAKPQEKYEAYKDALQAKDSDDGVQSVFSKSLKPKTIDNEASSQDEPRAEALIRQPLLTKQQNSIEEPGVAIAYSSTEHVVAITDRPTVKFLYSNKYRKQTVERTLAESLQNAGYITSANGRAQKFRSANVLEQLRQFLAGSDSNSNSDESGSSQFVDEYSLPEIKAAVNEIKELYLPTDQPATTTIKSSTTTLRPTTTPMVPPTSSRPTAATVTAVTTRQVSYQSKAYSFPSTLSAWSADTTPTARTILSTSDFSSARTPKAPPVSPTPSPTIATATPCSFTPPTARASRVNNIIKSSIAAAALGSSPSTYQPPVSAAKAQKFQFGFAPNNKNHQHQTSNSNHNGAAASVKCSDSTLNAKCNEIPSRNHNRNRGSAIYANQDRDVLSTPNRGTHPPRTRPTLKPSGTIVSKAQEFVDIYRYPPSRPDPIYPQPTPDKTAAKCRKDVCQLPDCYCGGKEIPGGLSALETPQIVLMTFDDAVNIINIDLYEELFNNKSRINPNGCPWRGTFYLSHEWTDYGLVQDLYSQGHEMASHTVSIPQIVLLTFDDSVNDLNKQLYTDLFEKGRVNPNGCPITATFYVSHEWTDYSQVQNLYADGHEMASHTVSHSFGEQFSQKKWTREIAGQREILSAYGGVKLSDVRGMRAPFLSVGGNKMYKMLYDSNFTYDSSMPVYENRPPSWPYTLDYKIFHDCMIPPCPTRSYPGVWQVPMVMWQDLNGGRCSMGDACSNPSDADGVTKMIMKNFERHYTTNRAPFGLFYHAAWFTQPHHKEGFIKFLDAINAMQDVWIITNWQALQWVRDPTPTSRINSFQPFQCDYSDRPKRCNNPKVCNLWHKSGVRYMKTCQPCPDIYPWTGKSGIRSSRIDNEVEEPAA